MISEKRERFYIASTLLGGIVLMVSIWVGSSYFEARAFNNVTGKNVSTLDAMFINLRVQEPTSD